LQKDRSFKIVDTKESLTIYDLKTKDKTIFTSRPDGQSIKDYDQQDNLLAEIRLELAGIAYLDHVTKRGVQVYQLSAQSYVLKQLQLKDNTWKVLEAREVGPEIFEQVEKRDYISMYRSCNKAISDGNLDKLLTMGDQYINIQIGGTLDDGWIPSPNSNVRINENCVNGFNNHPSAHQKIITGLNEAMNTGLQWHGYVFSDRDVSS
jgi:hypothetical protein